MVDRGAPEDHDFGRLMPLTDALAALLDKIAPVASSRRQRRDTSGLVAADAIRAPCAFPPQRIALRDGYAVTSQDTTGATPYSPVYLTCALPAVRAGAALADGHDAILPPNAVSRGALGTEVLQAVFPGSSVRGPGEDLAIGDVIVGAGDRIRPDRLAALALIGIEEVAVRVPRLSIVGASPSAKLVADLAAAAGATVGNSAEADLTVLLCEPGYAATSAAVRHFVPEAILIAHGLAVNPGTGSALLTMPRSDGAMRLVFIVPDRLEDVLAVWLLIIAPCLAALAGAPAAANTAILPLAAKIVSAPGLADLVLLRRTAVPEPAWVPIAIGTIPWSAFAMADAYCSVAAEQEGFSEGTPLTGFFL